MERFHFNEIRYYLYSVNNDITHTGYSLFAADSITCV